MSPRFQLDMIVAECAEVLRHSYWTKGTRVEDVLDQARRIAEYLPDDPDVVEFVDLVDGVALIGL